MIRRPPGAAGRLALFSLLLILLAGADAAAEGDIPIIIDGFPLDGKAIVVKNEVYVPAWILENYAHTKVNWLKRSNILEILTTVPAKTQIGPQEGTLKIRIGFYLEGEGFVIGGATRLYVLNVDPKEFKFPEGKTPAERAHEGAIERIGKSSKDIHEYLSLPPTERFAPRGWRVVSRIPNSEIAALAATVDKYEILYKSLYFDLLTNLILGKESQIRDSGTIDDSLKGIRIENVPVNEDGLAQIKLPNGIYFLYARMLHKNRQVVWDLPVSVRGADVNLELSNRNAALMQ